MIPRSTKFRLLGRGFTLLRRPADENPENSGYCEAEQGRIRVYVDPQNPDLYGHAACHELMHAIFECAGRNELSEDETLVETTGGLLWQALSTGFVRGLPPVPR